MKISIEIEDREAFDWWKGMVERSLSNLNSQATIAAFDHLTAWKNALDNAVIERPPRAPRAPIKRSKTKRKPKLDKSGLSCNVHPTYGAKYAPRTECEECWAVYAKFHPMEVKKKRADWERKTRTKAAAK